MRSSLLLVFLLQLCPVAVSAIAVPISLEQVPEQTTVSRAVVHLTAQAGTAQPTQAAVEVPGRHVFDLPEGSIWRVRAEAPGFWSAEQVIAVEKESAQAISLQLFPTGQVKGRWKQLPGETAPSGLAVRFSPVPAGGAGGLPAATVSCPVREGSWECELPAGHLDLRLRAEGFVPMYHWDVEVERGRAKDLGILALRRGASVAGWLETEAGGVPPRPIQVNLTPESWGTPERPSDDRRLRSLGFDTRSNERGFFQIEGVAPGNYVLTIREAGYAAIRVAPVVVREGLQTEVLDRLVLGPPLRLDVSLSPPVDPYGLPWRIQLIEKRAYGDPGAGSWKGVASREGRWSQGGLTPGDFLLSVADDQGGRWESRELSLASGQAPVEIEIPLVEVRGTLTLGDEPLAASIWLGGRFGQRRVRFEADEDGRFQGFLPGEGTWKVEIAAEQENLRLALHPVDIHVPDGKRYAEVALQIPDTLLAGETVDEAGRKMAGVAVSALASSTEVETDGQGEFEIRGLEPGTVLLEAEHGSQTSGTVEAFVKEEGESPRLRLVLRKKKEIHGRVASASGPVPGAELLAFPAVDVSSGASLVTAVSGADGRFTLQAPTGARQLNLLVFAPGFALRLLPVAVEEGQPLEVAVEATGGTLVLDLPESAAGSPPPLLLHGGTFTLLPLLARWVRLQGGPWQIPQSGRLTIPNVEIGAYRLCPSRLSPEVRQGREPDGCSRGFLAPFGELTLDVPGSRPAPE